MPREDTAHALRWALVGCFCVAAGAGVSAASIVLEAELGIRTGTSVSTAAGGYSGTGYVTGFDNAGDSVRWEFAATNGVYELQIRFRSQFGPKGFDARVNGAASTGMFPESTAFAMLNIGLVELVDGTNTLEIGGGWNYYEIDAAFLVSADAPPPPLPVAPTLVNPAATFATRMLMRDLCRAYGHITWSGQQDSATELAYVQQHAGTKPLIISGDLIDYSPSRVAHAGVPVDQVERWIALEGSGHVQAMAWHWNAPTNLLNTQSQPWWRGFYTEATTFDFAAALANTNSAEYTLLLRDIDAIAAQLHKFASNNIPVLWRPLHESEGGWFWWGARGPEPFKQLWRLLYARLTSHHQLDNLIWVLTSTDPAWYPGDDVVDVVGVDAYPTDPSDALSSTWLSLLQRFDGKKLLALTEFGGVPDIEKMQRLGVWWAWFAPWTGQYGPGAMPSTTVQRIYQLPSVFNADDANAVAPEFVGSPVRSSNSVESRGTGPRGSQYEMWSADNLFAPEEQWQHIGSGGFRGGVFMFSDPETNLGQRFYRLIKR